MTWCSWPKMGGKNEKGEVMEWSVVNTKTFIEKFYERVKNGQLQGSTFKTTTWEEINKDLFEMMNYIIILQYRLIS